MVSKISVMEKQTSSTNQSIPKLLVQHYLDFKISDDNSNSDHKPSELSQKLAKLTSKTIKIIVFSNKYEFEAESECLLAECQPELQQYTAKYGYDLQFVDVNLNVAHDPLSDPYFFDSFSSELENYAKPSEIVIFLFLIGNKLGDATIPIEINQNEFNGLRKDAIKSGKNIELLDAWYSLDEKSLPIKYKLKPMPNSDASAHKQWQHMQLQAIFPSDTSSNSYTMSRLEQFARIACKQMPTNEFLIIQRHFNGLKPTSTYSKHFVDLKLDDIDKNKQKKLQALRDNLSSKFNDENKHCFSLNWDDVIPDSQPCTCTDGSVVESFNDNTEFEGYLDDFGKCIVSKLSALIAKSLSTTNDPCNPLKTNQVDVYLEATRHMRRFRELCEQKKTFYGLDPMVNSLKALIDFGSKNAHYPIFIYGNSTSGKTTAITRLGRTAHSQLDVAKCSLIVRYYDFTSQCSTLEGLLCSICEQLSIMCDKDEMPIKKTLNDLTKYFRDAISSQTKSLLILIDGIPDAHVDREIMDSKRSITNNYLEWLFNLLPANVHLIVSIRKPRQKINDLTSVSLFMNYYLTSKQGEHDYLFELPVMSRIQDRKEIVDHVKIELNRHGHFLSPSPLNKVVDFCFDLKLHNQNQAGSFPDDMHPICSSVELFLNTMLGEISKSKTLINDLIAIDSPINIDSLLKHITNRLEQNFNPKVLNYVFNYITASHHGLTETELIDVLSCNDDFFLDYYSKANIPKKLRFPVHLWLDIKYQLGDLICQKYVDNKITYTWSHDCIRKFMKQAYFDKIETMKSFHIDLANYFLEFFVDGKPFKIDNNRMEIEYDDASRFVSQQPLLHSETLYNLRRLNELWYQLMLSGDIHSLKENTFFNFEFLLAKCHGLSVQHVINDLDCVHKRFLDPDIILLGALLRKVSCTLMDDPLRLAYEILDKLRPLEEDYGFHLKNLLKQTFEWTETYKQPILIPLNSWSETPGSNYVTKIDSPTGIGKIAITPYNQHAFFSTADNEIYMYHIPSKKLVKKLNGHHGKINRLIVTHDNMYLISCSSDSLVNVWNIANGCLEFSYDTNRSSILCGVTTHSSEILIVGLENSLINLMRIDTGEFIHTFNKHSDSVTSLALSENDSILVSASLDCTVKRWSLLDMVLLDTIDTMKSPIRSMLMTGNTVFIVSVCDNSMVNVNCLVTGKHVHNLSGDSGPISHLASRSSDPYCLYATCSNSKLYLYDIRTGEPLKVLMQLDSAVNDLVVSADNSFLFLSTKDSLYVFNVKNQMQSCRRDRKKASDQINCCSISDAGDVAITGDDHGSVKLWNLINGQISETMLQKVPKPTRCVRLSQSYRFSVSAYTDCSVKIYDNEICEIFSEFNEHKAPVNHIYILEESKKILSADADDYIKVWLAKNGQLVDSIVVPCKMLCCSPDGNCIVSGSGDNMLKIWRLDDAKVIRQIDHIDRITQIIFTLDSTHIITGSDDNSCKIWKTSSGHLTQVLIEHDDSITSIAVPSKNDYVVSGSKDKSVILWNFHDGSVIFKLNGCTSEIVRVAISSDATVIFSCLADGTINAWSALNGSLLCAVNIGFSIADMLVAFNGCRLIIRSDELNTIPILGITHKPTHDANGKMPKRKLLKPNKEENYTLPIKPKTMICRKKTPKKKKCNRDELNEEEVKSIVELAQNEPMTARFSSEKSAKAEKIFKNNENKKSQGSKSSEQFAPGVLQNPDTDQKKTICCMM